MNIKQKALWRVITGIYYLCVLVLLCWPIETPPQVKMPFLDKAVHIGLFVIAGVLLQYICSSVHQAARIGILLSGISELAQVFSPTRTIDVFDFISDVFGIILGIIGMSLLQKKIIAK